MLECLLGGMALFAAAVEVLECLLGGMALFGAVVRPVGAGSVPECLFGGMAFDGGCRQAHWGLSRSAGVALGRHGMIIAAALGPQGWGDGGR